MEELLEFIQRNPDPREVKRALAVKLVLQNYSYFQIREILNVSVGFITKWKQIFIEQGIAGLKLGYKGASSYLSTEQKQVVLQWLSTKNYWDLEELQSHLEQEYSVMFKSKQSYYALFKEAGISWKKTQKTNPKQDPELVEKKTGNHSTTRTVETGNRGRKFSSSAFR